jgi:NhaP-type Na+/H+ or K+/H+ antiporter
MPTSFRDARDPALAAVGVLVWWTVGWLAVGPSFEPGGPVFALYVLLVVSTVAGRAAGRLRPLPPLVGQLLAGCLLRNLPAVGPAVGAAVHPVSSASARTAALGVILARAGLSLDVAAVWRLRWPASRLAFAPAIVEACVVALVAAPALRLPASHAVTLGFLLAGISPAVVIPSVLSLQERGYGVEAGVPALTTTAASVDVVFAIAGFGAAASTLPGMGSGGAAEAAWRVPAQIVGGCVAGYVAGRALGAATPTNPKETKDVEREREVPGENRVGEDEREGDVAENRSASPTTRASGLMGVALLALFGGARAELTGGAALAVVVASATAGYEWGESATKRAGDALNLAWTHVAQPMLFALIGAAVDLERLDGRTVGLGAVVLAAGLAARCGTAFAAAGGGLLGVRERIFVAVAWTPKATVQAALAGLPLDAAVKAHGVGSIAAERAEVILAVGVLAIVVTAPLGAAAVAATGERLLARKRSSDEEAGDEETVARA